VKFIGQLLDRHLQRYPRMELADLYKLLHQAAMGAGHAVDDVDSARRRLEQEAAQLGSGPQEPIADPISPDGVLARIHLRPYLAAGRDLGALLDAFVETARARAPDADKLAKFCGCLGDLADTRGIPFGRSEVEGYIGDMIRQGYPVVRHSDAFRAAYRPAYRVVALDLLPALKPA
jgi:hypothetical protein